MMMHKEVARVVAGLSAVALVLGLAAGCAERRSNVSGQVTYNGAPLNKAGGRIVFVGPNGAQVAAEIGGDGNYQAFSVPAGANRVAIYYLDPEVRAARRFPGKGGENRPPASTVVPVLTPRHYASVDTSNLSVEIKEDTVFNADLVGPKFP
jgi:hypothetical protein